jgi:MFS family permease
VTEHPSDEEKMRRLPWAVAFGASSSVFGALTYFGPVFVLFLSELGIPKTGIGLLLSMMPFAGLLALLLASAVARAGVKRVFVSFYFSRKVVTVFLVLAPWVAARYGTRATFAYVGALVCVFAVCRAIAETAIYPWFQEIVPVSFRGRYQGINHTVSLATSALALAGASLVMDRFGGLSRFQLLLIVGVAFGFLSTAFTLKIPGGAPATREHGHFGSIRKALGDRNLRLYLLGMGLVILALHTVIMAFLPLFMKEEVGLTNGQILLLQVASYVTGLLSGYLWGWAADHGGSKPVVLLALSLMLLLPIWWLAMPRHHPLSFVLALAGSAVLGVASAGWLVGDQRLLYVNVVPFAKRTEYMALLYAWMGLVGGIGPIVAGASLDLLGGFRASWWVLSLEAYTPLFIACLLLLSAGFLVLSRVQTEGETGMSALLRSSLRRGMSSPYFRLRRQE